MTDESAGNATPNSYRPLTYIVPALAMLGMGLWNLGRQSAMSNDETATRWASLLPLHRLWHLLNHLDAVHGFYYLLMHVYMRIVGTTPTIMRVPSVIAMAVAVAVVAIIARRLSGSDAAGLFAGLIVAFTPSISFYAQTARSYALVYLVAAVMTYLLVRISELETSDEERRTAKLMRRLVAYGALTTVIGYLNELALLLLIAHAVSLLLARSGRKIWTHWAAAAVPGAVLVVPLIVISRRESGVLNVLKKPSLSTVGELYKFNFGNRLSIAIILGICAVVALIPLFARRASEHNQAPSQKLSLEKVAAPILFIPGGLLLIEATVTTKPLYTDRYVLYGEMGAAMLAAAGLDRLAHMIAERVRWGIGGVVCLAVLLAQLPAQAYFRTPDSRRYNMGSAAMFVSEHKQQGDAILFLTSFYRKVKLGYPKDFDGVADVAVAKPPALVGNFRGTNKPLPKIKQLLLLHGRVWVVGYPPDVQLPEGSSEVLLKFLENHYPVIKHRQFHGVDVTLWRVIPTRN